MASSRSEAVAGTPAAGTSERPKGLVPMLGLLSAIAALSIDTYIAGLPEVAAGLGSSTSAVQASISTCLVGLGLGQLVSGPLSDIFGRRGPLLAGLGLYLLSSIACAAAPGIELLLAARLLQGFGGAFALVIARAVVRDAFSGSESAQVMSTIVAIIVVGPIVAPLIGAGFLGLGSWRWIFASQTLGGLALLVMVFALLPETLPPERRRPRQLRSTAADLRSLLADSRFRELGLTIAGTYVLLFAYLGGSPFVFQDIYGLGSGEYSLIVALNGFGLVCATQLNRRLVRTRSPQRLLIAATATLVVAALVMLAVVRADAPVGIVIAALLLTISPCGMIVPNAIALAIADFPEKAGSASALIGAVQFSLGAWAAPAAGIAGSDNAIPMVVLMLGGAAVALALAIAGRRHHRLGEGEGAEALELSRGEAATGESALP